MDVISVHATETEWVETTRVGSVIDCKRRVTETVRRRPSGSLELSVSSVEGEKTCLIPEPGYSDGNPARIAEALERAGFTADDFARLAEEVTDRVEGAATIAEREHLYRTAAALLERS